MLFTFSLKRQEVTQLTLPMKVGRNGGNVVLAAVSSPEPPDEYEPLCMARIPSQPSLLFRDHCHLPLFIFANTPHIESSSTLAGIDSKQHHFQEGIRPNFCQDIMKSRIILVPKSWCHWLHHPVPIQPIDLLWLTQREMGAHWREPGWPSACSPGG